MAEPAKPVVQISDFPGMVDNADTRDLPPGAAEEQVNATCHKAGVLVVRHGLREVSFES